jgi:hypothetical protein
MYSWLQATTGMSVPTAQTHTPASATPQAGPVYRVNTIPNSTPPINRGRPLPTGGYVDPGTTSISQALREGARAGAANQPASRGYIPSATSAAPVPLSQRLSGGYRPPSAITAKNAAAAAGATGAQANAAAVAASRINPVAARQALQAAPLIGAGMAGVFAAGGVKAAGGSWAEAGFAGVGAGVGAQLGYAGGLAVATGSLGTGNPFIAAAAPLAGSLGGAAIGGELGRRTPSILGRIPGVGGAVAKGAGAIIPGAGLLYGGGSLLNGWLQPETVAGSAGDRPIVTPATEGTPNQNGIVDGGLYRITWDSDNRFSGGVVGPNPTQTKNVYGPVTRLANIRTVPFPSIPLRYNLEAVFQHRNTPTGAFVQTFYTIENTANNGDLQTRNGRGSVVRLNAPPDPDENPPTPAELAPVQRPYNPLDNVPSAADPATNPPPTAPAPNNAPSQTPALRPSAPPTAAPVAPNPGPALPAGDPLVQPAPVTNPTANPDPTAPPNAAPSNVPSKLPNPDKTIQPALQPGQTVTLPGGTTITGTDTGYKISSPTDSPSTIKLPNGQTLKPGESSSLEGLLNPALAPILAIPALAIPALLTTPTTTTGKVGDPTTPGNFTQVPPVTPTPPIPNPPDTGCRCNGPLLANQAAQAAELATLLAELERIKAAIGVQGLPASVPDQIAKENPGQKMIGSLAELHLWQVQQLDGVLGKWPVGIPIPTPAGTTTVGMPNVAEAVAEMVGMLVSQQVTAAQILNTSSRAMVQAGSATQQAHLAHLTAKANADFLGYESRPSSVDMPLTYTPGADIGEGLLSESTAKIKGFENTDNTDIKAIFAELLQAAAIIRAVYWRRLDPKGDLKTQLRQNIRGQSDFLDEAAAGGGDDSDWEEYLRQVAEGFKARTGEANPYGRPPAEGPQIKDRSPGEDKT